MKKTTLLALVLGAFVGLQTVCPTELNAQEVETLTAARTDLLSRKYLRPSRSVIYATDGSDVAERLVEIMQQHPNEQFDVNEIVLDRIELTPPKDPNSAEGRQALQEEITRALEDANVGRMIMKSWFPRYDETSKGYSLEVLEARGAFAATDADIVEAKTAHRDLSVQLNTIGEQLIDRSYVIVYYVYLTEAKEAKVSGFVYKLDFGAETMNAFYTKHFNSPEGIDKATFPLKFVYATKENKVSSFVMGMTKGTAVGKDTNYETLAMNVFQLADVLIANNVHDLETQAPIAQTSPISAKIGTKENLKTDDRFFVVENVLDPATGETKTVRRGAVRVGMHIADNKKIADGNQQDFTRFYQYAGFNRLEEGMTLISKPDLGVGLTPLVNFMYVGAEVDYRASDLLSLIPKFKGKSVPGIFLFVRMGIPFGLKASKDGGFGVLAVTSEDVSALFIRMTYGLRKEFNFARALNASVELGYGTLGVLSNTEVNTESYGYLTLGGRFGCYVHPNINVFAHLGSELWVSGAESAKAVGIPPINFGVGTRISF